MPHSLTLATSIAAQGILTWAVPLAAVVVLLVLSIVLLRRRHPE